MQLKNILRYAIDKRIKSRAAGAYPIYAFARRIVQAYENSNDVEMHSNGEHWLQARLGAMGSVVAFDVGANQGEWTQGLLRQVPNCRVYCFEPVPTTFAKLQENVHDARAQLFHLALSSAEGTIAMNSAPNSPDVSSVHDVSLFQSGARTEKIEVPASTGDRQMADLGVNHLGLLKIDAEGHDLDVLRGFEAGLDADRIDVIQFEYNIFTLSARRTLRKFFDLLGARYLVCRLLPAGLEACGYHSSLDDFRQTNWVALRLATIDRAEIKTLNIVPARGLAGDALRETLAKVPLLSQLLFGRRA